MKPAAYVRSQALHRKEGPESQSEEIEVAVHEGYTDEELRSMNEDAIAKPPEPVEQETEFKQRVNRHALRIPRRKAEAIVKKEMGIDA